MPPCCVPPCPRTMYAPPLPSSHQCARGVGQMPPLHRVAIAAHFTRFPQRRRGVMPVTRIPNPQTPSERGTIPVLLNTCMRSTRSLSTTVGLLRERPQRAWGSPGPPTPRAADHRHCHRRSPGRRPPVPASIADRRHRRSQPPSLTAIAVRQRPRLTAITTLPPPPPYGRSLLYITTTTSTAAATATVATMTTATVYQLSPPGSHRICGGTRGA